MRRWIAALLLLWPLSAAGQSTPAASTLPPIGLPLAPIGLPLAPIGLAPPSPEPPTQAALHAEGLARHAHGGRPGEVRGGGPFWPPASAAATPWMPYYVAVLPAMTAVAQRPGELVPSPPAGTPANAATEAPPIAPPITQSRLLLEIDPRPPTQVWVDGYFVGSGADVRDGLSLEPGLHRVELRTPGFEPLAFDTRIDSARTITYRGRFEPTPRRAAPRAPAPATAPSATPSRPMQAPPARPPIYFVPGCYLGDVRPELAGLPATCDLSTTVVYRP